MLQMIYLAKVWGFAVLLDYRDYTLNVVHFKQYTKLTNHNQLDFDN